jgi:hypothetical protein
MGRKKGNFGRHAGRIGNRVAGRAKNFVNLARAQSYDHVQLAKDIAGTVMDVADFWGVLFGGGGSPALPVVNLGPKTDVVWKAAGDTKTVLLDEAVPEDALWPLGGGGNPPLLKLRPVDGGAAVNLDLQAVTIKDEEGLELEVTVRGTGAAPIAVGEYFGNLYFTSASLGPGNHFAAVLRATVV